MSLRRTALLHHAFFSAVPGHALTPGSPVRQALERTWRRVGDLGFDRRLQSAWPAELPPPEAGLLRPGVKILAARGASDDPGWNQAFAYQLDDTVGVSVLRGLPGPAAAWTALTERWESPDGPGLSETDPPTGVFGLATVLLGLVPAEDWDRLSAPSATGATALGAELADELGLSPGTDAWSSSWFRPKENILGWELPASGVPGTRRVLVVAPETAEVELLHWLWSGPRPGLPVFTGYLRHAAQLRYQYRILTENLQGIRKSIQEVDSGCRYLARMLDQDQLPVDRILAVESTLGQLQLREGGVIARLADIRGMTHAVKTARRNMVAMLGPLAPDDSGGPLHHDSELAQWTLEQLEAEQVFLSSAMTKATEIGRISSVVVAGRLAERRENLFLFQTSLVGSLLMVLAGIQSLQYDVDLPGPLLAPVIALLGALALFLPSSVLHWRRRTPRPDRWARLDLFFAGCVGASLGWLAATGFHLLSHDAAAPPPVSVLSALAGTPLAMFLFDRFRQIMDRRTK
ncbi:CATRA conflict system CASPASE/TPR repeat-associated protein [Actinocorallia aurantiaca]|uniref:CorA-like Mg2+ transporter protein n=1 Tax=Actinocorallia aurantiaca TaxID=46204 RepID=A0ABN3UEK9_9ACTN